MTHFTVQEGEVVTVAETEIQNGDPVNVGGQLNLGGQLNAGAQHGEYEPEPVRSRVVEFVEEDTFAYPVDDPNMQWVGYVTGYESHTTAESERYKVPNSTGKYASMGENRKIREDIGLSINYVPQDFDMLKYFTGDTIGVDDEMPSVQFGEMLHYGDHVDSRRLLGCVGEEFSLTFSRDEVARGSMSFITVERQDFFSGEYIGDGSHANESSSEPLSFDDISNVRLAGKNIRHFISEISIEISNDYTIFYEPDSSIRTEIGSVRLDNKDIQVGLDLVYVDTSFVDTVTEYQKVDLTFDIRGVTFTFEECQFPEFKHVMDPEELTGTKVVSDPVRDMNYGTGSGIYGTGIYGEGGYS